MLAFLQELLWGGPYRDEPGPIEPGMAPPIRFGIRT